MCGGSLVCGAFRFRHKNGQLGTGSKRFFSSAPPSTGSHGNRHEHSRRRAETNNAGQSRRSGPTSIGRTALKCAERYDLRVVAIPTYSYERMANSRAWSRSSSPTSCSILRSCWKYASKTLEDGSIFACNWTITHEQRPPKDDALRAYYNNASPSSSALILNSDMEMTEFISQDLKGSISPGLMNAALPAGTLKPNEMEMGILKGGKQINQNQRPSIFGGLPQSLVCVHSLRPSGSGWKLPAMSPLHALPRSHLPHASSDLAQSISPDGPSRSHFPSFLAVAGPFAVSLGSKYAPLSTPAPTMAWSNGIVPSSADCPNRMNHGCVEPSPPSWAVVTCGERCGLFIERRQSDTALTQAKRRNTGSHIKASHLQVRRRQTRGDNHRLHL